MFGLGGLLAMTPSMGIPFPTVRALPHPLGRGGATTRTGKYFSNLSQFI